MTLLLASNNSKNSEYLYTVFFLNLIGVIEMLNSNKPNLAKFADTEYF